MTVAGDDRARKAIADAWLAARLFALDPAAIGGIVVRASVGPVRDRWLADLRAGLAPATPWRVAPLHVDEERLLGGLDLAATLQRGRPVAARGLLAEADGGVLVLSMAERVAGATVAHVAAALDAGTVTCVRHGIDTVLPARFGVIALDESDGDDAPIAPALLDRLALVVDLRDVGWRDLPTAEAATTVHCDLGATPTCEGEVGAAPTTDGAGGGLTAAPVAGSAPARAALVGVDPSRIEAICAAASALGIDSIRASLLAVRVARLLADMRGAGDVGDEDAARAAGLVLAPRATQRPVAAGAGHDDEDDEDDEDNARQDPGVASTPEAEPADRDPRDAGSEEADDERNEGDAGNDGTPDPAQPLDDVVLAAAAAAIPARLLLRLGEGRRRAGAGRAGRAGEWQANGRQGRPAGIRRARPGGGARLDVIATLRAAAPWQRLRGRPAPVDGSTTDRAPVRIRGEDFHVARFIQRGRTTTIFAVDASGSAALHRLAETKGAVELLLADCYVRRDSVAVIAFRGRRAELLLPPTRSLVRAKRSLAGLAGGGGTPLGAGLDAAGALADTVRRRGDTPVLVVLSDGRANVGRDGAPGRVRAEADAQAAARSLRSQSISVLFIDTSPQPQAPARQLAEAMGARYVPLPHAEANALSAVVRAGTTERTRGR